MDPRDAARSRGKWYESFDEEQMAITFRLYLEDDEELVTVPARYEVCELCSGKGTHVNPSIDAHGISAYEFAEDPDFAEEYFSGMYDVSCYNCEGLRVVPEIYNDILTKEQKEKVDAFYEQQRQEAMYRAEDAYAMRMGY